MEKPYKGKGYYSIKEEEMSSFKQSVNGEMLKLELELIQCPRQPGKLRISRRACALRYCEAQKVKSNSFGYGSDLLHKHGLEICRTCPDGRRYSKTS
jgi:hypothetical protein